MPDTKIYERYLQRIWLDHMRQWVNRKMHPLENMPDYGREITNIVSDVALLLLLEDPRKERETRILEEYGAVFIYGIGWVLDDGYPHEMRAADYDDWVTPTIEKDGKLMHGLNGDILVWNHVTQRRHELSSMGIRVTKESLALQMKLAEREDELSQPYHQMILNDEIPLSIGGAPERNAGRGHCTRSANSTIFMC